MTAASSEPIWPPGPRTSSRMVQTVELRLSPTFTKNSVASLSEQSTGVVGVARPGSEPGGGPWKSLPVQRTTSVSPAVATQRNRVPLTATPSTVATPARSNGLA